ncbi:MAG TPA: glycosyltransferase [Pyrinomonadaceae bacterium]|jgi:hypothetical protein|nr:glycosyltransferase [Pyrinomonadaceae bacterium]
MVDCDRGLMGLRVLITNNTLAGRAGSELYVRDTALALLNLGHRPVAYSTVLGAVARELQDSGVPVVDDLNNLSEPPNLIHGQQHMELMTALLHFPTLPAIQFCHNAISWYEKPVLFPRIRRYVAVDHICRKLLLRHQVPEEQIRVLLNFVDLDRFKPRRSPLPAAPNSALLFSNYANEHTHLPAVREACARASLKLDVIGSRANAPHAEPEKILGDYDIVFAKGRCALEAMAVGAAVVVCDSMGVGSLVTMNNIDTLRPLNFGRAALNQPLDAGVIAREIKRYDSADALQVSQKIRASAGHEPIIDELINLYQEVVREHQDVREADTLAESRATAAYLRQLKLDFAANADAATRLRERLERVPGVGKLGVKLARSFMRRHRDREQL